jgi:hypothetical protein
VYYLLEERPDETISETARLESSGLWCLIGLTFWSLRVRARLRRLWERVVVEDGKIAVRRSAARHVRALEGS